MAKLIFGLTIAWLCFVLFPHATANAQMTGNSIYESTMPPGQIGHMQLMRRAEMRGYAQPVRLLAPGGASISVFDGGAFHDLGSNDVVVGMFVGSVYRIKVTNIPGKPGMEVFPSVEVINRMYPPAGLELKFPVEVHLDEEDLVTAANGAIVTRVVYLEDPDFAVPEQQERDLQPYFDVGPARDPLHVAQQLGRPMAIVRGGAITPDNLDINEFAFGGPPVQFFQQFATQYREGRRSTEPVTLQDFNR
ncbi:MAG TPA: hypothetical protein PKD64_15890 [Pirellulaceae bacterium]|nr:hypothetical protein [Pirellulaceae bacterium]HMO93669.1 hypothetical protein [Pirellulaceae bacterium]HMP68411.1 hypothetical protein [Pirellulaceae bacterium]